MIAEYAISAVAACVAAYGIGRWDRRCQRREIEDMDAILQAMIALRPEARSFALYEETTKILGRDPAWGIGGFYVKLERLERDHVLASRWAMRRPGRKHRDRLYSFTKGFAGQ